MAGASALGSLSCLRVASAYAAIVTGPNADTISIRREKNSGKRTNVVWVFRQRQPMRGLPFGHPHASERTAYVPAERTFWSWWCAAVVVPAREDNFIVRIGVRRQQQDHERAVARCRLDRLPADQLSRVPLAAPQSRRSARWSAATAAGIPTLARPAASPSPAHNSRREIVDMYSSPVAHASSIRAWR
jgi:hypothetical protein